jgi:hypothetical protein
MIKNELAILNEFSINGERRNPFPSMGMGMRPSRACARVGERKGKEHKRNIKINDYIETYFQVYGFFHALSPIPPPERSSRKENKKGKKNTSLL